MCFSLQSYRVGKNHDTKREPPAAAGAARTAGHFPVLFSQKILAVRKGNDLYRPVRDCSGGLLLMRVLDKCGNDYMKRDITLTQNDFLYPWKRRAVAELGCNRGSCLMVCYYSL